MTLMKSWSFHSSMTPAPGASVVSRDRDQLGDEADSLSMAGGILGKTGSS